MAEKSNVGRKRREYDQDNLRKALIEVKNKSMSIRAASRAFNIPRSTLQDKLHGRAPEEITRAGPATVLTSFEGKKIADWLIHLAKCGFPRRREDLISTVQAIVVKQKRNTVFKDGKPGRKWYRNFLNRHPELSERQPENISKGRAVVTENSIRKWFTDLKDYLISIHAEEILDDPTRIFNGDETSFCLSATQGTVIAPRRAKSVYEINTTKEKETLTVLMVFSGCGQTLPPMVVFPYVRPPKAIVRSMPDMWVLGRSESGWMKSETFYEYVANGFNKWLERQNIKRLVLFLVGGHKSHLSMPLSDYCSENQIILYSLPPNTTHILQPADVGVFKAVKHDFKITVREWQNLSENIGKAVNKTNFCPLLSTMLNKKDRTAYLS